MSESIRTEQQRRIAELEALVSGLNNELNQVLERLHACEENWEQVALLLSTVVRQKGRRS